MNLMNLKNIIINSFKNNNVFKYKYILKINKLKGSLFNSVISIYKFMRRGESNEKIIKKGC